MRPTIRNTMQSIVEARRFAPLAKAFLQSVGAVDTSGYSGCLFTSVVPKENPYPFSLETTAGLLLLRVDTFGVVGQFQDVKRACEYLSLKKKHAMRLNSIQWMRDYYGRTITAEQALDDFKASLLPLLLPRR